MDTSKTSWYRLPAAVLEDTRLSLSSAVIYAVMLDRKKSGSDESKITKTEIMQLTQQSESTVKRAIRQLKETGYILNVVHKLGNDVRYIIKSVLPEKKKATTTADHVPNSFPPPPAPEYDQDTGYVPDSFPPPPAPEYDQDTGYVPDSFSPLPPEYDQDNIFAQYEDITPPAPKHNPDTEHVPNSFPSPPANKGKQVTGIFEDDLEPEEINILCDLIATKLSGNNSRDRCYKVLKGEYSKALLSAKEPIRSMKAYLKKQISNMEPEQEHESQPTKEKIVSGKLTIDDYKIFINDF